MSISHISPMLEMNFVEFIAKFPHINIQAETINRK